MIGIVGGVGPCAGLDLAAKVMQETSAAADQEHLPLVLLSLPDRITDRTDFLLGRARTNPAAAIAGVVRRLQRCGATVVGIPCNTAHAEGIFGSVRRRLRRARSRVRLLHMIQEVSRFLRENFPRLRRVGLLCTVGTYRAGVYPRVLEAEGLTVIVPPLRMLQRLVHRAIYDRRFGIKARPAPPTEHARTMLLQAAECLRRRGAEAIVLGCSEIPLALADPDIGGVPLIDANRVLARALIREFAPSRLRPLNPTPGATAAQKPCPKRRRKSCRPGKAAAPGKAGARHAVP